MLSLMMGIMLLQPLPDWNPNPAAGDWLLHNVKAKAGVFRNGEKELVIANGLIARKFRVEPNLATVALDELTHRESFVRAVKPEALITLNGQTYPIGGLTGQPDHAFLFPQWLDQMKSPANAFQFKGYEVGQPHAVIPWKQSLPASNQVNPAPGVSLTLKFAPPAGKLPGVEVQVHYEMYDNMPVLGKWITIHNQGPEPVRLNKFISETLAVVEPESIVESTNQWREPNLTVVTDYSFGGMAQTNSNRTAYWVEDPEYQTQVNYDRKTPCLLEVRPPLGPDVDIAPGKDLATFRTYELVHDSYERERQGLAIRQMYRTLAPWSTQNPIMLHLTSTDPKVVHTAIDQAAEVGFEMVIFSFGSGLNMEDASPANIARFKAFREYANSKGLLLGGYSLLASRRIDDQNDVINPKTGKTGGAIFGNSPCLGSQWGERYFQNVKKFIEETGFQLLEHDGSYPGDVCASTTHPGHRGLEDSQWTQFQQIADFYRWCQGRGVYLNVPDYYFLSGSNKTGMGYRETNWSLPRAQQHIHARQNLFDGTWTKTPSMGWMFVPLVEYQGGGPAATIEPLKDHLHDYEMHLANNFGYGAQACYRGPRLYDSPETKAAVIKWVSWFKKYRAILESDLIHVRRADGHNLDCILHVNPNLKEKGLAMIWNPTDQELTQVIKIPVYYTGLRTKCQASVGESKPREVKIDPDGSIALKATVPPQSCIWVVIR
ncbi:MAG: alpha-galactosidase [Armatimonadetes bacterium]|nr:alpha-galactosidase [Armatimonadota bacterium]